MLVLARAYGGRPLVHRVTGSSSGLVYLVNPSSARTGGARPCSGVGFPVDAVYELDLGITDSLTAAWEAGDIEAVNRLWETARLKTNVGHQ
jgi:hypothetical protein